MIKVFRVLVSSLILVSFSVDANIELLSQSTDGILANNASFALSTSEDGRYVVLGSSANNLVAGDTNGFDDIFVHDKVQGTTERVSVSSSGEQANHASSSASISTDGRYVAFLSRASNLVSADTNNNFDVFVHDRETGLTTRVSVSSAGVQGNGDSLHPFISADGRVITFDSTSTNLVDTDTNNDSDIFVHDREVGKTERVNLSSSSEQANGTSLNPSLSANGRFVVFSSTAKNLVASNPNDPAQIFIRDRILGKTERMSVSTAGVRGNGHSYDSSVSADGRFVVFASESTNLGPVATTHRSNIFVHDRQLGTTKHASISSSGLPGDGISYFPSISANGRFVTFVSFSTNLVRGDSNDVPDIFVHDLVSGTTQRVNVSFSGEQANGRSFGPSISADSQFVVFHSEATNLVVGDTNGEFDVFITENSLLNENVITVETLINNKSRESFDSAAQFLAGTRYQKSYKVTNQSPSRIYQVRVFEAGELVCNFYTLNPGESRTRCSSNVAVLVGNQNIISTVTAKVSGSNGLLSAHTQAFYKGHNNVTGELSIRHHINGYAGDTTASFASVFKQAHLLFRVENTGPIELYRVRLYHDPVSSANTGWQEQCMFGTLLPGEVRYCRRTSEVTAPPGFYLTKGRAQGLNANVSATGYVNAENDTWFRNLAP